MILRTLTFLMTVDSKRKKMIFDVYKKRRLASQKRRLAQRW
jgi:hypothetical protein